MLLPLLFSNIFSDNFTPLKTTVCNIKVQLRLFECKCARVDSTEMKQRIFSVWRFHHLDEAGSCLVQCFTCFRFLWSEWSGADMLNMLDTLPGEPLLPSVINNDQSCSIWSVITTWSPLQCQHSNMLKHLQCPVSCVQCPVSSVLCPGSSLTVCSSVNPVTCVERAEETPPPLLQYK